MSDTQPPQPQPVTFNLPAEEPLWAAGDNIGVGSKVLVDFVSERPPNGDVLRLHKAVSLSERQLAELEGDDDYYHASAADCSPATSEYLPDPGDADPDAELLRVQTVCEVQADGSVRPLYGFASRELTEDEGSAFLAEQEAKRKADPFYRDIEEEIYGSDNKLSRTEREYFSDDSRRWWWNNATVEERRAAVMKFRSKFPKRQPPPPPKYKTAEQKRREKMEQDRERAARIASEREVSRIMRSMIRSMSPGEIRAWLANVRHTQ